MNHKLLTPEEIAEEREIEERRIAFLDAKLAALTPQVRHQLTAQLHKTGIQAFEVFKERVKQWKLLKAPAKPLQITLGIRSSNEFRSGHNGRVFAGCSFKKDSLILLLDQLMFAPKEVIRRVCIHECLHLFYDPSMHEASSAMQFQHDIKPDYREDRRVEEEWVRRMEDRICGEVPHLAMWETSVSVKGDEWKEAYADLKRTYGSHRRR